MIKNIRIENFRSIRNAELAFPESRLTVFIGANGTGKSNVVKSLEFISQLNRGGLSTAVASQGGHHSIIPKAINTEDFLSTATRFRYELQLVTPPNYPPSRSAPKGEHEIEIQWMEDPEFRVDRETITYYEPLAVAKALSAQKREESETTLPKAPPSSIRFVRRNGNVYMKAEPEFNAQTRDAYVKWIGLPAKLLEDVKSAKELNHLLEIIGDTFQEQDEGLNDTMSLLEWAKSPINFSAQSNVFRQEAQSIKRFDLQLSELRKDQQVERSHALSRQGSNLPTAVRWTKEDEAAWDRLLITLKDLAPHVDGLQTERLKTGREYVEFLERQKGRPVESWDSSDGTLRALAVLIAMESQSSSETVVVEEPELGLHPWAVRTLMDYMRDVIERKNLQVILTTHSQQVLQSVEPDEIVVTTRTPDEGTRLQPLTEIRNTKSMEKGELGRLWVKGLLGGVPEYS